MESRRVFTRQDVAASSRSAFTLMELMIVVGIIAILAGIALAAMRGAFAAARETQTRSVIQVVDGVLQDRLLAYERGLTEPYYNIDARGAEINNRLRSTPGGPVPFSAAAATFFAEKRVFASLFPQRFQDLCGFDGLPGDPTADDNSDGVTNFNDIDGDGNYSPGDVIDFGELGLSAASDDPPTAIFVRDYLSARVAGLTLTSHTPETEAAELLYIFTTNSPLAGLATVDADEIPADFTADTDGDGLLEFVDGWGRPLRFYHDISNLVRPTLWTAAADASAPAAHAVRARDVEVLKALTPILISSVPQPSLSDPAAAAASLVDAGNPLNRSAGDTTAALGPTSLRFTTGQGQSNLFAIAEQAAIDGAAAGPGNLLTLYASGSSPASVNAPGWPGSFRTLSRPMIVSAGPDETLGLGEPAAIGPARYALPDPSLPVSAGSTSAGHPAMDNITNLQGAGQ